MTPGLKTERPFSYHIGALLGHFCYRTMNNTNNTEYSIASKLSIRFLSAACRKAKCSTLYNWYLFSFLRTLTTWHCPHSPTTAAEHCAAINLSAVGWAHSSKPPGLLLWAQAGTNRRMPKRCTDPALHTT